MIEQIESNIENAEMFHQAVIAAKNSSDKGKCLVERSPKEYLRRKTFWDV